MYLFYFFGNEVSIDITSLFWCEHLFICLFVVIIHLLMSIYQQIHSGSIVNTLMRPRFSL